jgi:hypothetical protein
MMETMIPPQVGMRLRTKKMKEKKEAKKRAPQKKERKKEKMREKERRGNATILFHTCASK